MRMVIASATKPSRSREAYQGGLAGRNVIFRTRHRNEGKRLRHVEFVSKPGVSAPIPARFVHATRKGHIQMSISLRNLFASTMLVTAVAGLATGCASESVETDGSAVLAEDGDALGTANRSLVLDATRKLIAEDELKGAAFLKRGDKLVFRVRKYVERGNYAILYGDAMGRKTAANGKVVDYELGAKDYAGSPYANYAADGTVDGTHVETLMVKKNGKFRPEVMKTEWDSVTLFQFASTDTNANYLLCRAQQLGFKAAELGGLANVQYCP